MLCFKMRNSEDQMLMNIYLQDFSIKDLWSGSKDYEYIIYMEED